MDIQDLISKGLKLWPHGYGVSYIGIYRTMSILVNTNDENELEKIEKYFRENDCDGWYFVKFSDRRLFGQTNKYLVIEKCMRKFKTVTSETGLVHTVFCD